MDRLCRRLGKASHQLTADEIAEIEHLKSQELYQAYTYMFTDFIPMLHARGLSHGDIVSILDDNARRIFAGDVLPKRAIN